MPGRARKLAQAQPDGEQRAARSCDGRHPQERDPFAVSFGFLFTLWLVVVAGVVVVVMVAR